MVSLLIGKRGDFKEEDPNGKACLFWSLKNEHDEEVKLLLEDLFSLLDLF